MNMNLFNFKGFYLFLWWLSYHLNVNNIEREREKKKLPEISLWSHQPSSPHSHCNLHNLQWNSLSSYSIFTIPYHHGTHSSRLLWEFVFMCVCTCGKWNKREAREWVGKIISSKGNFIHNNLWINCIIKYL